MTSREQILREIFFPQHAGSGAPNELELTPSIDQVTELAELLVGAPTEEDLQRFFTRNSGFITGLFGFADSSTLAFFVKPRIGTKYIADFGVMTADQGSSAIHLVELEPSYAELFTQAATPARRYQAAIGQVTDWQTWIEPNKATFLRDLVNVAQTFPLWPARGENGAFRTADPVELARTWDAFGGNDFAAISYTIICGRWANLAPAHRKRLTFLNAQPGRYQTLTYDQVARTAYQRPLTTWDPDFSQ